MTEREALKALVNKLILLDPDIQGVCVFANAHGINPWNKKGWNYKKELENAKKVLGGYDEKNKRTNK
jgi:hypothetical protein